MKIYKKKNKIIVELDFWQHKSNLYDPEEEKEQTHNLIGLICGDEQGLAQVIDLSYKGTQQIGEFVVHTDLKRDDFIKLCEELFIGFHEYPVCANCRKVIYGCCSSNKKGEPLCDRLEKEIEEVK